MKRVVFLFSLLIFVFVLSVSSFACTSILNPDDYYTGSVTVNDVTFMSNDDGTYTLNGTSTAVTSFRFLSSDNPTPLEPGAYILSGGIDNVRVAFRGVQNPSTYYAAYANPVVCSISDSDAITGFIVVSSGVTLDNVVIKPALTLYCANDFGTPTLDEAYEQGKTDAVIEFKGSTEYENEIKNAKAEGYDEGLIDGVAEFKLSDEYKQTLSKEYDSGYSDGLETGENEAGKTINVFGLVTLVVTISIITSIFVVFFKKKKRKKKVIKK